MEKMEGNYQTSDSDSYVMPPPRQCEKVCHEVPLTQEPSHQIIVNTTNNVPSSNFVNTSSDDEDYLISAIATCLCCFWPLGLCGLLASIEARSKFDNGDHVGGRKVAKKARAYSIASFVIGFAYLIISIFLRGELGPRM